MNAALLANLQAAAALLLIGGALVCLPRAYLRVVREWAPGAASDRGPSRVLIGALAAGAAVRWLVAPLWIVTMYIGYLLTEQAIELQISSHYGLGSQALYHALFAVLPRDHRSLMWVNSVVGVLALPLSATLASRLLCDRRAGAAFALLSALLPLFVKNDNSDANNVPCLLWLFGGLVLWEEYLDARERGPLLGAGVLLSLAAVARPEMPLLVPMAVVGVAVAAVGPRRALSALRDPALLATLVMAALLVAPHALHVASAVDQLEGRGSLPGVAAGRYADALTRSLLRLDTVLTPSLYPMTLLGFAAFALLERDMQRLRARLTLLVLSAAFIAIYGLDLCVANMARVHVPGALWFTMLAAAGLSRAWTALPRAPLRAALVAVVALSAVPSARRLWAPTNEQAEEELIREAIAALPSQGPFTLVRMDAHDRDRKAPGADFTHYHFPDYLVRPPARPGRVSSLTDWIDQPDEDVPAFFYAGTRCYSMFRVVGVPPPRGDNLQPACARLRERFVLEPVIERDVPNRGDVWLEYYGDAPTLKLGLYRIRPRP